MQQAVQGHQWRRSSDLEVSRLRWSPGHAPHVGAPPCACVCVGGRQHACCCVFVVVWFGRACSVSPPSSHVALCCYVLDVRFHAWGWARLSRGGDSSRGSSSLAQASNLAAQRTGHPAALGSLLCPATVDVMLALELNGLPEGMSCPMVRSAAAGVCCEVEEGLECESVAGDGGVGMNGWWRVGIAGGAVCPAVARLMSCHTVLAVWRTTARRRQARHGVQVG